MTTKSFRCTTCVACALLAALLLAPPTIPNAQAAEGQDNSPRSIKATLALQTTSQVSDTEPVFQNTRWRGRYYGGRPYGANYYGSPRGNRYGTYYGPNYYQPYYGGYRARYYGTPSYGYYDSPYGGAARVGGLRFYW